MNIRLEHGPARGCARLQAWPSPLVLLFDVLGDGVVVLDRYLFVFGSPLFFTMLSDVIAEAVDVAVNGIEESTSALFSGRSPATGVESCGVSV